MAEVQDRRAVPRATLDERVSARVRGLRGVHLLDLNLTGARIEHLGLLRLDAFCDLELPPAFDALPLPAQVVWCTVIGRQRTHEGESHLVSHTGLRFTALTVAQHAALAAFLQDSPVLDSLLLNLVKYSDNR
jgi:PilZ domain